jgi:hypothetical protein
MVYELRFQLLIVKVSQEVSTIASYSKFLLGLGHYNFNGKVWAGG